MRSVRRSSLLALCLLSLGAPAAVAAPPANDNLANATSFTSIPQTLPYTLNEATTEVGEPFSYGGTVWFKAAIGTTTSYTFSTGAEPGHSDLWVYSGPANATFGDLVQLGATVGNPTSITVTGTAGQYLYARVDHGPMNAGTITLTSPSGSLVGAEPVICGAGETGTSGPDVFGGTPNADVYDGLGGADRITGNAANDCLEGSGGEDTIGGGYGDDRIAGNANADDLDGGYGNDVVSGGGGADSVSGGYDNDTLYGGAGTDTLKGGYGNDTLDARDGAGGDIVDCGAGTDTAYADPGDTVKSNCETVS